MGTDGRIYVANGVLIVLDSLSEQEKTILERLTRKYMSVSEFSDYDDGALFFPASEPQTLFEGGYARRPLNLPSRINRAPAFQNNDINPLYVRYNERSYTDGYILLNLLQGNEQTILQQAFERACLQTRDGVDEDNEFPIETYGDDGHFAQEDIDNLATVFRSPQGMITGQWLFTTMN